MGIRATLKYDSVKEFDDWRRAVPTDYAGHADTLAVTRLQESLPKLLDRSITSEEHAYLIGINMTPIRGTSFVDGKKFQDGVSHAGAVNIFQPGSRLRFITHGHIDACNMLLPIKTLSAIREEAELKGGGQGGEILRPLNLVRDRDLLILFKSLADIGSISSSFDQLHADSLGMAIVCELLSKYSGDGKGITNLHEHGLSGLKLKRVEEFVRENISQPISLSALARTAGLSRMHFAAQFRRSTGMSPHDYVLREKVRHAQQILRSTSSSLMQAALSVGFLNQSHFSTVFKRIVGESPARWRADCNIYSPKKSIGGYTPRDAI